MALMSIVALALTAGTFIGYGLRGMYSEVPVRIPSSSNRRIANSPYWRW